MTQQEAFEVLSNPTIPPDELDKINVLTARWDRPSICNDIPYKLEIELNQIPQEGLEQSFFWARWAPRIEIYQQKSAHDVWNNATDVGFLARMVFDPSDLTQGEQKRRLDYFGKRAHFWSLAYDNAVDPRSERSDFRVLPHFCRVFRLIANKQFNDGEFREFGFFIKNTQEKLSADDLYNFRLAVKAITSFVSHAEGFARFPISLSSNGFVYGPDRVRPSDLKCDCDILRQFYSNPFLKVD